MLPTRLRCRLSPQGLLPLPFQPVWVVTASWVGESLVMTPAPHAVVLEKPLPRMPWAAPASTLWSSELILTLST